MLLNLYMSLVFPLFLTQNEYLPNINSSQNEYYHIKNSYSQIIRIRILEQCPALLFLSNITIRIIYSIFCAIP